MYNTFVQIFSFFRHMLSDPVVTKLTEIMKILEHQVWAQKWSLRVFLKCVDMLQQFFFNLCSRYTRSPVGPLDPWR